MEQIQDYYTYLGVARDASSDEIRRIIIRKRRNCQDDVEKYSYLQEIQDVLCDPRKRKQYDTQLIYGNQIENIKSRIANSEDESTRRQNLEEARKLCEKILLTDPDNIETLQDLANIEKALGNIPKQAGYLKKLIQLTDGEDKLEAYHNLGELYRALDKVDDAIKCFYVIYKEDPAYLEDVRTLVRLCNEKKHNIKAAIQILNDCLHRCEDSRLKIAYLCETLRAILILNDNSYQKVEAVLYKKLEGFRSEDEEENLANAVALLQEISQCMDDQIESKEWFASFEKVYLSYHVENEQINNIFLGLKQAVELDEARIHRAIELYKEEVWTDDLRMELSTLIANDAAAIRESLEYIKKKAPLFWNLLPEFEEFEKIIDDNLVYSNELKRIKNDGRISANLKKMLELFLINIFVDFERIKDVFCDARDSFFESEDKQQVRDSLERLEAFYPASYRHFAGIFLDGKSTVELYGKQAASGVQRKVPFYPNAKEGYEHKPYISGFLELIAIVAATCCLPPVLLIILAIKYSDRHKKTLDKIWKGLKPVCIIVCVVGVIGFVGVIANEIKESIERKQRIEELEAHNCWLTEEELEEKNQLEDQYNSKSNVEIRYRQIGANGGTGLDYAGQYIYLIMIDKGYQYTYKLDTNCLEQTEQDELWNQIQGLFNGNKTDMEKVEAYFELAYGYAERMDSALTQTQERLYGTMDMNNIYYEMGTSASVEEVQKIFQTEAFNQVENVNSTRTDFYVMVDGITGVLSYWEDDSEGNNFTWTTDEPITQEELMEMFNVQPSSEIYDNQQILNWHDRVELTVSYRDDSTYIIFRRR